MKALTNYRFGSGTAHPALFVSKTRIADQNGVAMLKEMFRDSRRIDLNAVLATAVNNLCLLAVRLNDRVPAADVGGLQLNVVVHGSPDREAILKEWKPQYLAIDRTNQKSCRPV